jgi:hypothetical protein
MIDRDEMDEQVVSRTEWVRGERAFLLDEGGGLAARIHLEDWYPKGRRTASPAWVVSWLDPAADSPTMLRALVELPALVAEDDTRQAELTAKALEVMARGPEPATARSPALKDRLGYAERFRVLELLIDAWDEAETRLGRVLRDPDAHPYQRYLALSDVLSRTYTVDRTLGSAWEALPIDIREDASCHGDEIAERAIAHNTRALARSGRTYAPVDEGGLAPFFARRRDLRPYRHWSGHMVSGAIQHDFFLGLRWIRGQMTYRAVIDPIELWQYEPGVEPRWKWKDAAAITTEFGSGRNERACYERFQGGRDVLGQLSHLLTVFWDVKWSLRKLSRRAEVRRPGLPTRD